MELKAALTLEIGNSHQPIVTSYQLGVTLFQLYQTKSYRGQQLSHLRKELPQRSDYARLVEMLVRDAILQPTKDVPGHEVFTLLGQDTVSADIAACCIDPFCYVSHLSAMEYHGFTDRIPKVLFLTSPAPADWSRLATQKMLRDLGEEGLALYREAGLPALRRLRLTKLARKTVERHMTVHCDPGAYIAVHGKSLRVATIGRTFLDMIREPDLCGGIYHVLDVFSEHASRYLRLIVETVDRHGTKIDKVRAGYILGERLGLVHDTITSWQQHAQRGGSRRLYAGAEYSPRFSETWCLSLNIEEAEEA